MTASYLTLKTGSAKHKMCGAHNHYKLNLRGDTVWDEDGEGWLFPLRCYMCNKLGGKADYELCPTK